MFPLITILVFSVAFLASIVAILRGPARNQESPKYVKNKINVLIPKETQSYERRRRGFLEKGSITIWHDGTLQAAALLHNLFTRISEIEYFSNINLDCKSLIIDGGGPIRVSSSYNVLIVSGAIEAGTIFNTLIGQKFSLVGWSEDDLERSEKILQISGISHFMDPALIAPPSDVDSMNADLDEYCVAFSTCILEDQETSQNNFMVQDQFSNRDSILKSTKSIYKDKVLMTDVRLSDEMVGFVDNLRWSRIEPGGVSFYTGKLI